MIGWTESGRANRYARERRRGLDRDTETKHGRKLALCDAFHEQEQKHGVEVEKGSRIWGSRTGNETKGRDDDAKAATQRGESGWG